MSLVALNQRKQRFYRYDLGSGRPIVEVKVPIDTFYGAIIHPVGSHTYLIATTPKRNAGPLRNEVVYVVRNDKVTRLPDNISVLDQHPTHPEIFLFDIEKEGQHTTAIYSVIPTLTRLDHWPGEYLVARFPEWWPVIRADIFLRTSEQPLLLEEPEQPSLPLDGRQRYLATWFVTPYGRYRDHQPDLRGLIWHDVAYYGFGDTKEDKYMTSVQASNTFWLNDPIAELGEEDMFTKHIVDARRDGEGFSEDVPDEFMRRMGRISGYFTDDEANILADVVVIDTVDVWRSGAVLQTLLQDALGKDMASYMLAFYFPSVVYPTDKNGPPRPPGYRTLGGRSVL